MGLLPHSYPLQQLYARLVLRVDGCKYAMNAMAGKQVTENPLHGLGGIPLTLERRSHRNAEFDLPYIVQEVHAKVTNKTPLFPQPKPELEPGIRRAKYVVRRRAYKLSRVLE